MAAGFQAPPPPPPCVASSGPGLVATPPLPLTTTTDSGMAAALFPTPSRSWWRRTAPSHGAVLLANPAISSMPSSSRWPRQGEFSLCTHELAPLLGVVRRSSTQLAVQEDVFCKKEIEFERPSLHAEHESCLKDPDEDHLILLDHKHGRYKLCSDY